MQTYEGFDIDLRPGAPCCLEAQDLLQHLDNTHTFHVQNNLRPALGIYNVSTARVFQKVQDVCRKIEALFRFTTCDKPEQDTTQSSTLERALIDYIELLFYAAADHVDDLKLICSHFYANPKAASKDKVFQQFNKELKAHKRFVSAIANHIKHSQHRIRLYHVEFQHSSHSGIMYGYIVEGVENGVVGPSPVFHVSHHSVFSVTSLPWQVLIFILSCSRSLHAFLASKTTSPGPSIHNPQDLTDAVIAASRIPFYTMDEIDYLSTVPFKLRLDDNFTEKAYSGLYGSITSQWNHQNHIQFGKHGASFAGDGITRTFRMLISPSQISLRRVPKT